MRTPRQPGIGWGFLLLFGALTGGAAEVLPLERAHAHNDYEHKRPLLDALARGFCSVEADVWLVDGELLVAHDRDKVQPGRTLQSLYLRPLRERTAQNGGRVYPGGPTVTLLIDFKSESGPTYERLRAILEDYESMLTVFTPAGVETNAVTVIISGNDRPLATLASEPRRLAAVDGRIPDLENPPPRELVPLISDNWRNHFTWQGEGEMPDDQAGKLSALVARAHQAGRRLRLWSAPDVPAAWQVQHRAGVDLINTDKLEELSTWLRAADRE